MTLKSDIQAQIAALQAQLAILNGAPNDTYNLGTIARFAANSNTTHFHYKKTAVETWTDMSSGVQQDLASWILNATQSNIGYFEVYILSPAASPIYSHS